MALSDSCRHGMPARFGCDDCLISGLDMRVRELEAERDAARNALNHVLQCMSSAAAAEREACAQACDTKYYQFIGPAFGEVRHGIATCAASIRARGKP